MEKRLVHQGVLIRRTVFGRWETPGLVWGGPHEYHIFHTLKSAKAFIEAMNREEKGG